MRKLLCILTILLIACESQVPKSFLEHTIKLENEIGEMRISLPPEFDTTYSWTNYTDNICDDKEMMRFANSKYSLLQETGFIYLILPDSLYQFTVFQSRKSECEDKSIRIDKKYLEQCKEYLNANSLDASKELIEIRTINNRDFIVSTLTNESNGKHTRILKAKTIVNGQMLIIEFKCYAINVNGFLERMEKSLSTIKITAGNKRYSKCGFASSLKHLESLHTFVLADS